MAATQKPAPKKSSGFQGVRNAFWIIAAMFVVAVCIYMFVLGNPDNFVGGDPSGEVLNGNIAGTIYKGGVVVPVLITLMLTVLCLSIERFFAQKTAFGKMATTKFVIAIKAALAKNDFVEAQNLCDKQRGTIANVVGAANSPDEHAYPCYSRNTWYSYRSVRYCNWYDQVIRCSCIWWWW